MNYGQDYEMKARCPNCDFEIHIWASMNAYAKKKCPYCEKEYELMQWKK